MLDMSGYKIGGDNDPDGSTVTPSKIAIDSTLDEGKREARR